MQRRVIAVLVGAWWGGIVACSGSTGTVSRSGPSGSSSSGGGTGSSGSSGAAGDDGAASEDDGGGGSVADGSVFNTSGWACPSDTVLGGYSSACVSCLETMCTTQLDTCMTGTCASCEGPVFSCETQSCPVCMPGYTGGSGDGGGSGSSGGEGGASGTCAALLNCCMLVAAYDPTYATTCTTTAESGDQTSCQSFVTAIASVAPTLAPYCE